MFQNIFCNILWNTIAFFGCQIKKVLSPSRNSNLSANANKTVSFGAILAPFSISSTTDIKFFDVKRRINFYPARQFFGVAVATARKTNTAGGNLGKFNGKKLSIRCTSKYT